MLCQHSSASFSFVVKSILLHELTMNVAWDSKSHDLNLTCIGTLLGILYKLLVFQQATFSPPTKRNKKKRVILMPLFLFRHSHNRMDTIFNWVTCSWCLLNFCMFWDYSETPFKLCTSHIFMANKFSKRTNTINERIHFLSV